MNLQRFDRLSLAFGSAMMSSSFGDAMKIYAPMLHIVVHGGTELLFMLLFNQKASPKQPSDRRRLTLSGITVFSYFCVDEDVLTLAT
jgi:hypothetical protein